jgi:Flp pilus assembly protein TadD
MRARAARLLAPLLALCAACAAPQADEARGGRAAITPGQRPLNRELTQGLLAEADSHWDQALAYFSQARARNPSDEAAVLAEARALSAQGRAAEAATLLGEAVKNSPRSARLLRASGDVALALGRLPAASDCLRRALELRPDDLSLRASCAWALHLQGRHDAVLEVLGAVPEASLPDYARLALGRSALMHFDPDLAARNLQAWLDAVPEDQAARLDLARAQLLRGEDAEALACLETVLAQRPDMAEAHVLLGHAHERAGQHELALGDYLEAVRRGADVNRLEPVIARAREASLRSGGGRAAP